ncbi:MAG: FxsA family protein [Opitutae bacterium]
MFGRMLLLFIFLPMIELYLLIMLGSRIGPMPTIGLIVLTGILGATLARQQGISVLSKIQGEMASGKPPTQELVEGALILVGGIVLLTPGIITDIFGFSLLVPPIRKAICRSLTRSFSKKVGKTTGFSHSSGGFASFRKDSDDVIDV